MRRHIKTSITSLLRNRSTVTAPLAYISGHFFLLWFGFSWHSLAWLGAKGFPLERISPYRIPSAPSFHHHLPNSPSEDGATQKLLGSCHSLVDIHLSIFNLLFVHRYFYSFRFLWYVCFAFAKVNVS